MIEYTGIIKHVLYYNEENKYIVCKVKVDEENKNITMVGYMTYASSLDKYLFKGDYVVHPKFGTQFQFQSYEVLLANEEDDIIRYLSSSLFKGIGKKQATAIVDLLGKDALNLIKEDKHLLDVVVGMTEKKRDLIYNVLMTQDYDNEVLSFFNKYGISTRYLSIIQSVYKEETLDVLKNNPYQLIDDIDGIGFKTADDLALKIGFDPMDTHRYKAAIVYALKEVCYMDGSTYHSIDKIYMNFKRYIQTCSEEDFYVLLDQVIDEHKIVVKEDKYYPYDLYESEDIIARTFHRWLNTPLYSYEEEEVDLLLKQLEETLCIEYDSLQKKAIHMFLKQSAMILTGGPGTGKSTIVNAIVKIFTQFHPDQKIALVAPTGRASKRLSEVTGLEACTIHRLLKWDMHSNTFAVNEDHPLEYDLLIIDEFSMVDTLLFASLLKASRKVSKILLIGDDQQLPSVSPGHVLKDLLDTQIVSTLRLTKIYRQASISGIVHLAHDIRNDDYNPSVFNEYKDIHFTSCQSSDIVRYVKHIVSKAIESGYDSSDIQVLAPMYNGLAGIDALNEALQSLLNPYDFDKAELQVGKRIFREGDKILQLKNRVDDNVFNGDIGTLVEINLKDNYTNTQESMIVDFDGTFVEYTPADYYTITHAYCMSIHKSQGSEFKIVVMPVLKDYYIMLRKNLLYTGLTRAKQSLFLLGEHNAFVHGILNNHDDKRKTTLKEKLISNPQMTVYDFM